MNTEVYLFGESGKGYTQYIDDSTKTLFQSIARKAEAGSQLIIHRAGTLMYYSYIHRPGPAKSNNIYVGLSYVINDELLVGIDGLCNIFRETIKELVTDGVILTCKVDLSKSKSKGPYIDLAVSEFYKAGEDYLQQVSDGLKDKIARLETRALPVADLSVSITETKCFGNLPSDEADIVKSLSAYSTISITDTKDIELPSPRLKVLPGFWRSWIRAFRAAFRSRDYWKSILQFVLLLVLIFVGIYVMSLFDLPKWAVWIFAGCYCLFAEYLLRD